MFIRRFFMGALLTLLVVGALGRMRHGNDDAAYRAGFADGQRAAAASSESSGEKGTGSETAVPPQANEHGQSRDRGDRMDRGHGHFSGMGFFPLAFLIGGFFKFALFALIIGSLFKFFGFGGRWHKGHRPPWAKHCHEDAGTEKSPEDVEPDIKVG